MDYNHAAMFKGVKTAWCDGLGCHWCGRDTRDTTKGHDGFCPVPAMFALEAETAELKREFVEQLEAKTILYRKVYEKADELLWLGESHRLPDFDEMVAWMENDEQKDALRDTLLADTQGSE